MTLERVLIGFLTLLCVGMIWLIFQADKECRARGGKMVGNGEYYTNTIIQPNGGVIVTTTEGTECTK